ncbi:hypothetical protein D7243_15615 [Stutzerimonas stutzeri]|nr:hypothetical protein [Stutzerimonas stutzeri]
MSTDGPSRTSLILADGYSYTELIPAPDAPGDTATGGFIRIFHAFFSPADEEPPVDVPSGTPIAIPEQH